MLPTPGEKNSPGESHIADSDSSDTQRLAQAIHSAGLGSPAKVALEALKPLHWIAGQFAWMLEPFVGALGSLRRRGTTPSTAGIARLLESQDVITELSKHLDLLMGEGTGHRNTESAKEGSK